METLVQIVVSGLTLSAMYAAGSLSLSLLWGSLGVLNMAHGAVLTVCGYLAYLAIVGLGLPPIAAVGATLFAGGVLGAAIYFCIIDWMRNRGNFETNVIIATVGLAMVLENAILAGFGAYPIRQDIGISGSVVFAGVNIPIQNIVILATSMVLMAATAAYMQFTRAGRAIRAVAQSRDAAQLMGVPVRRVFANVFMLSGVLAAASGIMLSLVTTLSPTMGYDPMLKAFIVCVIAGLGSIRGALIAALLMGLLEASIQFLIGVRFGFPVLLILVIITLIWRPYGLFGTARVARL